MPKQPVKKRATHLSNARRAIMRRKVRMEGKSLKQRGNGESCSDSTELNRDIFTSLK